MSAEWDDDAPGWEGFDAKAEFLMADGSIKLGEFDLEDSCFDGEDSYPIWYVQFDDGTRLSFYDDAIKGWRKTP